MDKTTHAKISINEAGETEVRQLNVVSEAKPGRRHSLVNIDVSQAVERIDEESRKPDAITAIRALLDTIPTGRVYGDDEREFDYESGKKALADEIRKILGEEDPRVSRQRQSLFAALAEALTDSVIVGWGLIRVRDADGGTVIERMDPYSVSINVSRPDKATP